MKSLEFGSNSLENEDFLPTPKTLESSKLSIGGLRSWLGEQASSFNQDSDREVAGANQYTDLDGPSLEAVNQKTGIREKLSGLHERVTNLIGGTQNELGERALEMRRAVMENFGEDRTQMAMDVLTSQWVSDTADALPFLGNVKKITEAVVGIKSTGEELTNKQRLIQGAMAAGALGADLLGFEVVTIASKGGMFKKIGTMLGQKGLTKGAKIFERTAQLVDDNPKIAQFAQDNAQKKLNDLFK